MNKTNFFARCAGQAMLAVGALPGVPLGGGPTALLFGGQFSVRGARIRSR